MMWRVFACCFSLCLVLPADAAIRILNNIEDLREVVFGDTFPYQGLSLLHWFASIVEIDQNEVIPPEGFQPSNGIYGFHDYKNCIDPTSKRKPLPTLYRPQLYYAVGNLNNYDIRHQFPVYVQDGYRISGNRDRIVIDFDIQFSVINHVYITRHYEDRNSGSSYDPRNTFEVSASLLRQLKGMSFEDLLNQTHNTRISNLASWRLKKLDTHRINPIPDDDDQTLYCIEELSERTHFGNEFPRHGLMLLYWFANNVEIDQNDVIRPWNFRPDWRDYGIQPDAYTIFHGALPDISSDRAYYSLGDLDPRAVQNAFPRYVTQDYHNSQSLLRNIDRIVIDVNRDDTTRISQVYITQEHVTSGRRGKYDPSNTFRVSPFLLRQIQDLNQLEIADEQRASDLQMAYPHAPGLMRFLTLAGYNIDLRLSLFSQSVFCWTPNTRHYRQKRSDPPSIDCKTQNGIKLEVNSTSIGQARITWSGIPKSLLELNVYVSLYENGCSQIAITEAHHLNQKPDGSIDTGVTLKPGLQVRLTESGKSCSTLWRGPEFDDANGVLPKEISGVEGVSLQLFTKDGYACARLYVKKSLTSWTKDLYYSWVGFYASAEDRNNKYKTYQWSIKFTKTPNQDSTKKYDTYEYKSNIYTGPGVQARLFKQKPYQTIGAETEPWEGVINPETVHVHDELRKK